MKKINDTLEMKVLIPPEEIVFVDMVFKSYEGIAMLNLDNKREGLVVLDYTPGTRKIVKEVLSDLGEKFKVEIIEDEYDNIN
ncbi:MAG: DUF4911 domain-containing protein [Bacillota bacterium]